MVLGESIIFDIVNKVVFYGVCTYIVFVLLFFEKIHLRGRNFSHGYFVFVVTASLKT